MIPAGITLRVARPTDQLQAVVAFYRDGLGFSQLSSFAAHNGFDGVILGHPAAPWHLEFTHQPGHTVGRAPTQDNLLVFYIPDQAAWEAARDRLIAFGAVPVHSYNPFWDDAGVTFEDPDGYRIVLQNGAWTR